MESRPFDLSNQQAFGGKEISEIRISPLCCDTVLLNVNRFRLVLFDSVTGASMLMDTRTIQDSVGTGGGAGDDARRPLFISRSLFSGDAQTVLASVGNYLHIWWSDTGLLQKTVALHTAPGYPLAVARKRNLVATASTIQTSVRVWDLDGVEETRAPCPRVYEGPIDCVECAGNRRLVYVKNHYGLSSQKGYKYMGSFGVDVWNVATGTCQEFLPFGKYGKLIQMEVSTDGGRMALLLNAVNDWYVALIDLVMEGASQSSAKIPMLVSHFHCSSFVMSFDWEYLATCCTYGETEVKLWSTTAVAAVSTPVKEIVHFREARSPVFTLDGRYLLYIDDCRTIIAYVLRSLAPMFRFDCPADRIRALPVDHSRVVLTKFPVEVDRSPAITVWEFGRTPSLKARLVDAAPGGLVDVSKDGRLAVDGYLQVFNLRTGAIEMWFAVGTDKEHTLVTLTDDGRYVIWADDFTVKVGRVVDGRIVARTSTHERATALRTMDHGYVVVLGREDGHLMTAKLAVPGDGQHGRITYRPQSAEERRNFLLDTQICSGETTATFDAVYRRPSECVADADLPVAGDAVRTALAKRADVPHTVILTHVPATGSTSTSGGGVDGLRPSTSMPSVAQYQTDLENSWNVGNGRNWGAKSNANSNNQGRIRSNSRDRKSRDTTAKATTTTVNRSSSPSPVRFSRNILYSSATSLGRNNVVAPPSPSTSNSVKRLAMQKRSISHQDLFNVRKKNDVVANIHMALCRKNATTSAAATAAAAAAAAANAQIKSATWSRSDARRRARYCVGFKSERQPSPPRAPTKIEAAIENTGRMLLGILRFNVDDLCRRYGSVTSGIDDVTSESSSLSRGNGCAEKVHKSAPST